MSKERRSHLFYLALLLGTILLVVFYLLNRAVDLDEHERVNTLISELHQLNTRLDRDALRIKAFRLNNYDPLVAARNGIAQRLEALKAFAETHDNLGDAFAESVRDSDAALQRKLQLSERIKTRGAIVRNALSFLPREIEGISERAEATRKALLSTLASRLQSFYIFPDHSRIHEIQELLDLLSRLPGKADNDPAIANVVSHTRIAIAAMAKVDETYDAFFAVATERRLNTLFDHYSDYHALRTRRADMVALLLLLAVIALFTGLGYSTRQVEKARLSSERAWNKLRDAIESIDEGFALYDPQDRLLLWNRNFEHLYPESRELLRPGLSFRQLLRGLIDRGQFRLDEPPERWYKDRLRDHKQGGKSAVVHLRDGRAMRISDYNTSDHGTATLLSDITARKAVEEQMHLSNAVFETTNEGILVTDAKNRIIGVNPAFCRITGYREEEVLGRNPSMFNSGHQDTAFYQEMWQQIQAGNQWAGEIWNRKKGGEVYPEWLSITTVRDDQGEIRHHVAVFSDITERKRAEAQIRWQANYDALTQLPNRALFHDRLQQAVAAAHRETWISALLFIDLDRFKIINDTFGHALGDRVLREAAHRLEALTGEGDTAARLGGDEFTLIMQDIPDSNTAAKKAEEIIAEISRPFFQDGNKAFIGASIGIALYPSDAEDDETLMRNADLAMYKAKASGRNQYHFYTQAMNDEIHARNRLETELHHAVERGEFVTWFQPIIDIRRQRVYGAEALIRWRHPKRGLLAPAEFIPLAEECGLIGAIGEWVLEDACRAAAKWRAPHGEPLKLSVNLSNQQRLYGLDRNHLEETLRRTGLPAEHLTLEMTESIILSDDQQASRWLDRLKSTGVSLSIDDFGTGYSSLGYLRKLPFDILKIDKSFIDGIETTERERSLVRAILAIAASLDLQVVAEGVENRRQYDFLRQGNCDLVQGYLFSRPLDNQAFQRFVETFTADGMNR